MKSKDISVVDKELGIFTNKLDIHTKVGAIKPAKKDLKSEESFIKALQGAIGNLDNGTYSIHHDASLFARFDVEHKQVISLHRWSKNTGTIMPCWNYFKE